MNRLTQGPALDGYRAPWMDVEGTMRKVALLIAATALFLGVLEVWAGNSWTDTSDPRAVFVPTLSEECLPEWAWPGLASAGRGLGKPA